MLDLKKVAVTGSLSAGKSSVCQKLKSLGAYVMSADVVVHQLLSPETEIGQQVIELFGKEIVIDQGIDRVKLATKVFADSSQLRALENILHPAVSNCIAECYQQENSNGDYPLFVVEVPLLYESKGEGFYDVVVAVVASEEFCAERFAQSGKTREEYFKRNARQLPAKEKAASAGFVIENNGSYQQLMEKVKTLYSDLTT